MKKVAVIQFPGNNCEVETARAVRAAGMDAEIFRWNRPATELAGFDAYILGGGFAYEDRGRAGVIAGKDPLMIALRAHADAGKPVLGICNGAQALVEAGFIPGVTGYELGMALARNKREKDGVVLGTGYYNTWVHMKHTAPMKRCAFTYAISEKALFAIPVAHGEGRFTTSDDALFEQMIANHQVVMRYCSDTGAVIDEFPTNPNGTMYNIAALCNPAGNVMAIMPHPERGVVPPVPEVFDSLRAYLEAGSPAFTAAAPLTLVNTDTRPSYETRAHTFEIMVDLIITDNEAYTMESALHDLGFPKVTLTRRTYWEVTHATHMKSRPEDLAEQVMRSGVLLNTNKESAMLRCVDRVCTFSLEEGLQPTTEAGPDFSCIVFDKEDSVGASKLATLTQRLGLTDVTGVHYGVYWKVAIDGPNPADTFERILDTHLLHNPHSQTCVVVR